MRARDTARRVCYSMRLNSMHILRVSLRRKIAMLQQAPSTHFSGLVLPQSRIASFPRASSNQSFARLLNSHCALDYETCYERKPFAVRDLEHSEYVSTYSLTLATLEPCSHRSARLVDMRSSPAPWHTLSRQERMFER